LLLGERVAVLVASIRRVRIGHEVANGRIEIRHRRAPVPRVELPVILARLAVVRVVRAGGRRVLHPGPAVAGTGVGERGVEGVEDLAGRRLRATPGSPASSTPTATWT